MPAAGPLREQIEEALRESEARYRVVVENSNDGITIVEAGHHVFVNQKLLEILAYDQREELIGKHLSIVFHPDDKERIARYNNLMEKGCPAPSRYEAKGITRDGGTVYFDISAVKITYRDRVAVLAFFRDITQRKQLEKQLQQTQKMEAIGTLAGGIAHDFNNILSAILAHTELAIVHKHNPAFVYDHLDQVLIATKRAAQLVQQILTFSRQKDLERKPLEISPLISETIRMLRASLPSTIDIQYNIEDQHGMVMADATQIHQVLMNLCTNAAYAMRGRSGLLRIGLDKVTIKSRQSTPLRPGIYVEKLIVSSYDDLLKELGYQVVSTTNSEEALALFENDMFGFDLVITDLTMPNLTGEELSKLLIDLRPDTPIIMCTGYSNQLSKEEAQSLGIRKYLTKPLVMKHLAHAVREVLDQR